MVATKYAMSMKLTTMTNKITVKLNQIKLALTLKQIIKANT